jgi:SAM-dependent methyltransferase
VSNERRAKSPSPTANIARQQRFWTRQAVSWDHGADNNPSLVKVVEAVLREASPTSEMLAIDLGCGSGQLTLRLAPLVSSVTAVDVSQTMIDLLNENAASKNIANVNGEAIPIEYFRVDSGSTDLVVSNYALHHLHDRDKAKAVRAAVEWLRPGGRLVIGDMMFGRGRESRDRAIISSKVKVMLKKGPGGWWRIAKNAARYAFRMQERPVSMSAWVQYFEQAGFVDVTATVVVHEAAVVRGTKPV